MFFGRVCVRFMRNVVNELEVGGFEEEGLRGGIDSAVAVLEVGGGGAWQEGQEKDWGDLGGDLRRPPWCAFR